MAIIAPASVSRVTRRLPVRFAPVSIGVNLEIESSQFGSSRRDAVPARVIFGTERMRSCGPAGPVAKPSGCRWSACTAACPVDKWRDVVGDPTSAALLAISRLLFQGI